MRLKGQPLRFLYVNSCVCVLCQTPVLKTVKCLGTGKGVQVCNGINHPYFCYSYHLFSVGNSSTKDLSFTINSTKMICCIAFT